MDLSKVDLSANVKGSIVNRVLIEGIVEIEESY